LGGIVEMPEIGTFEAGRLSPSNRKRDVPNFPLPAAHGAFQQSPQREGEGESGVPSENAAIQECQRDFFARPL
jgi:hypothetical protein